MRKSITIIAAIFMLASLIAGLIVLFPSQADQIKFSNDFIQAINKEQVNKLEDMVVPEFVGYALPSAEDEPTKSDIIEKLNLNIWDIVSADPKAKEIKEVYLLSYNVVDNPSTLLQDRIVQAELIIGVDYLTTDDQTKSAYANERFTMAEYKDSLILADVSGYFW